MSLSNLASRIAQRPVVLGSILAGLAAVAYGSTQFLARHIVTTYAPPLVVATLALTTGTMVLALVGQRTVVRDRHAPKRAFAFLTLAGICASAGVTLNYSALRLAPVVVVSPVTAITPLISLALAHIFLQRMERITLRIWLGAAFVVGGVILITLGSV